MLRAGEARAEGARNPRSKKMQMIIANRLTDGRVVFQNDSGGWVHDIANGKLLDSKQDAAQRLLVAKQSVEKNEVVDPYLIDVQSENGLRRPALVRERIRAFGPSVSGSPQDRRD